MKDLKSNLAENLSVMIELLSHTLEQVRTTPAPPVEGNKENIEVKIMPDKLETVKEREPEKSTDILADIVDKYCSQYVKVRGDKVSEIAIYQQEDRASACFNIKTSTGEFYHFYI